MASYAGFYVASIILPLYATPKAWTDWLRSNLTYNYTERSLNQTNAQMEIEDAIHRKRMGKLFMVKIVPVPPSEQADYGNEAKTIMITRVIRKRRGYIAQRPDSLVDKMGQEILRNQIGLEVEEWRTMWYNKYSYEPPYEAQFLEPGDLYDETKGTANGKKVKIVYTVRRRRAVNKAGDASNSTAAEDKLEVQ